MILGNNDGTKIDSAVFFSKLKMANRSKKIINVRANLTTQIYQASVGEVCREEGWPLPSCTPFMPVWLSCSHYFAVYGSFATSTPMRVDTGIAKLTSWQTGAIVWYQVRNN
jgi:hypothetical protein